MAIDCGANVNFDRLRHIAERAEIGEDRLPYVTFPLGHIESFRVELTYDDGDVEWANYDRQGGKLQLTATR